MTDQELPVTVQFQINKLDIQLNLSTGLFSIFAKPKDEFLKSLKMKRRLGATYWDDTTSNIRIGAFAKTGSSDEQRFISNNNVDHWTCFATNHQELRKLLKDAF